MKIIGMLSGGRRMNVSDIAGTLRISFKATSNHLAILKNMGVLDSEGAAGRVFYFLSQKPSKEFRAAFKLLLN